MIDKESLILGLHELEAIQFGEFMRGENQLAPMLVDLRSLLARPGLLRRIVRLIEAATSQLHYDRIAAVPMGGVPVAIALGLSNDKPVIYARPEGVVDSQERLVEGNYHPGEQLLVIDDVLTLGQTTMRTIRLYETLRLRVGDVVVVLDEGVGGLQRMAAKGYKVHPILTMTEVLDTLVRLNKITREQYRFTHAWLEEQSQGNLASPPENR